MFYSSEAAELRAFLRDKLGFRSTDIGDGWLIFDAPEADLGVHPTAPDGVPSGTADISSTATTSRPRFGNSRGAVSCSRSQSKITATAS